MEDFERAREQLSHQKYALLNQASSLVKTENELIERFFNENVENSKANVERMKEELNETKSQLKEEKLKIQNFEKSEKEKDLKIKKLELLLKNAKRDNDSQKKDIAKLNKKLKAKDNSIKFLRQDRNASNLSDMFSQRMSTRSSQNRNSQLPDFPPNNLHSRSDDLVKKEANPENSIAISRKSPSPDLNELFNSDTQGDSFHSCDEV